jgi:dihydrofolate reductase
MGGAEIYRAVLDRCDQLLVTRLKKEYAGDRFFPEFSSQFRIVEKIKETPEFEILRYEREEARSQESGVRSQEPESRSQDGGVWCGVRSGHR